MSKKSLDKFLLTWIAKKPIQTLNMLESDVWRKIRSLEAQKNNPLITNIIATIMLPKLFQPFPKPQKQAGVQYELNVTIMLREYILLKLRLN